MRKSLFKALVCLIATIVLFGCKNDKVEKADPAFSQYITGYTTGIVSNKNIIKIRLASSAQNVTSGDVIDEKLFKFSPSIDGKAVWADSRTIHFEPSELLQSNQVYSAKFYLNKVQADVPSKFKTFEFSFETLQQHLTVNFNGLQSYNAQTLKYQKVIIAVESADYVDYEALKQAFSIDAGQYQLKWNNNGRSHEIIIDSVIRTEKAQQLTLKWDGSKVDAKQSKSELKIEIPSVNDFKLLDIKVQQMPQQEVHLFFSDPISGQQNLNGLIELKNNKNIRLIKSGNIVKLVPRSRLNGSSEIIIHKGIKNALGYPLQNPQTKTITFEEIKPKVDFIGDGSIVPSSEGLVVPFKAVNLSGIDIQVTQIFESNIPQFLQVNQLDGERELARVGRIVYQGEIQLKGDQPIDYGTWNTFKLDLREKFSSEPGAIYRIQLSFRPKHSLFQCADEIDDEDFERRHAKQLKQQLKEQDVVRNYYDYYYDDYDYYHGNNEYRWEDRDNPCKISYYLRGQRRVERNILASNIGIVAKGGNSDEIEVATSNITSALPLGGVEIELFNYQNRLINRGSTNGDGFAKIKVESQPFLLVATKGTQKGYLRLDDGSALNMSMFDIGGNKTEKGLNGFIYTERGVYRPGDSVFINFILHDPLQSLPNNIPVVLEMRSPDGIVQQRLVKTNGENGFYSYLYQGTSDDPTGNWSAQIKVGGSSFSKRIKIETIKPNRLKMDLQFPAEVLSQADANGKAQLNVKWLHGAAGQNLRADVRATLKNSTFSADGYADYNFSDEAKKFESAEITIFDGKVDAQGNTSFPINLNVEAGRAPGLLKANFLVRAYEEGGNFSIMQFSQPYSPYKSYIGMKIPEGRGWGGALYTDENNLIPVVTVDEKGKPVNRKSLKVEIYRLRWRWWWNRSEAQDIASYITRNTQELVHSETLETVNGQTKFNLKFDEGRWGRHYIRITDPVSKHSVGQVVYLSYSNWRNDGGNNPGGAEMLTFTTNKKKYQVGETVKVNLPDAESGRALVSIESGASVVKMFWVELKKGANNFEFETNTDMTPNVFVNVALIQPHQHENDLPIRMYGVQPIYVENALSHLTPKIKMDDELRPEREVNIEVSETNGQPMTYTVAVVDEGLLDLTNFKTPDAWNTFYARQALGVNTWDMYKHVMGAFSGEMAGLLAVGGDEEIAQKGNKTANRFKPVVKFFGPFTIGKNDKQKHTFTMPNYVGSVKTMVVAGNPKTGAFGSAHKVTPVRNPLMVLATMPRVVGPSETIKLPVTVFALDKKIKQAQVSVKTNDFFTLESDNKQSVSFKDNGEKVLYFDLKVANKTGIGNIEVEVKGKGETASYNVEIDVRNPNPLISQTDGKIMDGKDKQSFNYKPLGILGTNNGVIELSSTPPINLDKRLGYLIRYPHGCIEQTTSSVFPQLFLDEVQSLSEEQSSKIVQNVEAGINRLKLFQLNSGGFSYWPGGDVESDWGTNYAGHFLIEAKAQGFELPVNFIQKFVQYQTNQANNWSANSSGSRLHYYNSNQLTQAYRLYTLALVKRPALAAMNRMRQMTDLSTTAKWRLAAAYQLIGKSTVAQELIANATYTVDDYKELQYTYGSSLRDKAMILEALIAVGNDKDAYKVLEEVAEQLNSGRWHSTQTTAFSLVAYSKFISRTNDDGSKINATVTVDGKKQQLKTDKSLVQVTVNNADEPQELEVKNNGESKLFVTLNQQGKPLTAENTAGSNDLKIEVRYLDLQNNVIDVTNLKQGTDFIAEVKVSHVGVRGNYAEMVLSQIFPSGWEIRNLRMESGNGSNYLKDIPEYEDIRDDRVYSYFDLNRGTSKTFRVLLNAAYLGKYYLPLVNCEAMYDNEIYSRTNGQWVNVQPQE